MTHLLKVIRSACSEEEFKVSGNKTAQMKNSKELRTPGPSFLLLP